MQLIFFNPAASDIYHSDWDEDPVSGSLAIHTHEINAAMSSSASNAPVLFFKLILM